MEVSVQSIDEYLDHDEPCEACAGRAAEYEHAFGCEHEWDYMRLSAAKVDACPERERASIWFGLWWRVCRPANEPLLPRWLAPRAWRRVDRAWSHWLRAGDRANR
jgi:hypothetical protein